MTVIGLGFLVLFAYVMIFRREHFLFCVALAMTVPDSAFIVVRGIGVSPYFVSLILLAILSAAALIWPPLSSQRAPANTWTPMALLSVALAVYIVLLTVGAPAWFAGTPIVSPRLSGTNEAGAVFTPLAFTDSNIAQLGYFFLNVGLVFYIARTSRRESAMQMLMLGLGVGIAIALFVTAVESLVTYDIHQVFDNSPRNFYATELSEVRMRGQFSEPSHLAAFATAALAFMLAATRVTTGKLKIAAILIVVMSAVCVVGSGAGTAAIAILPLAIVYVVGAVVRIITSWKVHPGVVVAIPAAVALLVLALPTAIRAVTDLVSSKLDSISYVIRAPQDSNAWDVLWQTHGLGVGLGSNRSSSLGMMMLSTVGIPGTVILVVLLGFVLVAAARTASVRPAAWALLAYATCAVISMADFTNPVLWLAAGACYAEYKRSVSSGAQSETPANPLGLATTRVH